MKKVFFLIIVLLLPIGSVKASDQCSYTITKDIRYGDGVIREKGLETTIPLYLDVYLPTDCQNGSDKLPVPIGQIHGGGFLNGSRSSGVENKIRFAKAGYAVFAIDYRLIEKDRRPVLESLNADEARKFVTEFTEEGGNPEQTYGALVALEDTIKAKEFVQKRFAGKIDTRWFIQGGSAGAFTAVNMAYLADYVFDKKENPTGIIEISGGIPDNKQHMSHGDANVLIIHGTADTVVPYGMSDRLVRQATSAHVPHQRITAIGSGHGLVNKGLYDWQVCETGLTVFDHVLLFIERSLSCSEAASPQCQKDSLLTELSTTDPK
jgi:predicted esterase